MVRCFWNVDAEDSDEERVSDVLELRRKNNLIEEILDGNTEFEESVEVSELEVVQDGINELEITEVQPRSLNHKLHRFLQKNNLK